MPKLTRYYRIGDKIYFGIDATTSVGLVIFSDEITITYDMTENAWYGDTISCGEWIDLEADEVEYYKKQLKLAKIARSFMEGKLS